MYCKPAGWGLQPYVIQPNPIQTPKIGSVLVQMPPRWANRESGHPFPGTTESLACYSMPCLRSRPSALLPCTTLCKVSEVKTECFLEKTSAGVFSFTWFTKIRNEYTLGGKEKQERKQWDSEIHSWLVGKWEPSYKQKVYFTDGKIIAHSFYCQLNNHPAHLP